MAMFDDDTGTAAGTLQGGRFVPFRPHWLVREGNIQTLLTLIKPRDSDSLRIAEQALLLDGGPDATGYDSDRHVRLLGYYTPGLGDRTRQGLVLLLHGWEGSSHSHYSLALGQALREAGYDVLRLNLRDHGATHHLNRGFFYATLLDEVAAATHAVAALAGDRSFAIVGMSLGGSFALRLAIRHRQEPFANLAQVLAVSPAINPGHITRSLDGVSPYGLYFRQRWLRSLQRKQSLFPDLFDFSPLGRIRSLWEMTEWLVAQYGPYASAAEYFDSYTLAGDAFRSLAVPVTIVAAKDDPVVPVADFLALDPAPLLDIEIHPTGGHVGFTDIFPFRHHLATMVVSRLAAEPATLHNF